jgi:RimJ/RimL family protein N-acetyltransferase
MKIPPEPPLLPQAVLDRVGKQPLKPVLLQNLIGQSCVLEPLDMLNEALVQKLWEISNGSPQFIEDGMSVGKYDDDELIWRFLPAGPHKNVEELKTMLLQQCNAPNGSPFVVKTRNGNAVGVVNISCNDPMNLVAELAWLWFTPAAQGTGIATESLKLMMKTIFEDWGYRRIEWRCNALNLRSKRAAERLGFSFERTELQSMIVKGRNRDTSWFSILDKDWLGMS